MLPKRTPHRPIIVLDNDKRPEPLRRNYITTIPKLGVKLKHDDAAGASILWSCLAGLLAYKDDTFQMQQLIDRTKCLNLINRLPGKVGKSSN